VYCEIGVRVGSRNEPLQLAGISHLLEHLLFKEGEAPGSRKNPAFSQIRAAGGEVNATTFFERTNYFCDVHADSFEEGWRGLANLVRAVGFDARDVELERKVVLQEAALDKNNPLFIAAYSILGQLFPQDPLGQPVIGFRKTLQSIRLEDVTAYYREFYGPDNAYALVVGDVDAEAAASLIAETLGGWEGPGRPRREFPRRPRISDERSFLFRTLTQQVYYGLGVLTDGETGKDRAAIELLARVLGGGKSSRLQRRIVGDEGLTSEFQTASLNISNLGLFAAGGAVDPPRSERFRSILREEFDRITKEPVGNAELDLAKALLHADLIRAFESNAGIAAFRADRLLYRQSVSRDAYLDDMRRLTPEDLLAAA
ncbi:MAG: M16 family metallopeptidase, partial [Vicinamibacteria bacterium]